MNLVREVLHRNTWYVWSLLSLAATIGLAAESTPVGAALSSPLVTMFITLFLCNTGALPPSSSHYDTVLTYLIPIAIPLLLLDANLKEVFKSSKLLLRAFLIGSLGTILGTFLAFKLVPMSSVNGASKIAAALCARHIGGAVNFVAVSDILQTPPELIAAALAADNVVVALYFAFLFAITTSSLPSSSPSLAKETVVSAPKTSRPIRPVVNALTISKALSFSLLISCLAKTLQYFFSFSPIMSISVLAVIVATVFPQYAQSISPAGGTIGVIFMQLFFAVTGAMGHIPSVLKIAPSVFLHTTLQLVIHFFFCLGIGKMAKIPLNEIALASNANVGGPTTAGE